MLSKRRSSLTNVRFGAISSRNFIYLLAVLMGKSLSLGCIHILCKDLWSFVTVENCAYETPWKHIQIVLHFRGWLHGLWTCQCWWDFLAARLDLLFLMFWYKFQHFPCSSTQTRCSVPCDCASYKEDWHSLRYQAAFHRASWPSMRQGVWDWRHVGWGRQGYRGR